MIMLCSSNFPTLTFMTTLYFVHLWHQCVTADINCSQYSGKSCKDCVDVSGCSYCEPTKQCEEGSIVKKALQKACEGQDWKVGQCIVSGKVLLIALPVTGFVVLVALICLVYCCCCRRKRDRSKEEKEDAKLRKKRKEISERHKEREKERSEKRDEIRKKYGIPSV